MEPLVSILIPAHNAEKWIAQTLESALAQSWNRKEIILVDDGSTDSTVAVAKKFEAKNVAVVTQCNAGASTARNHAFSLCQGDYVQWLDADDLLAPDKIEKQLQEAHKIRSARTLLSCQWGRFMYRVSKTGFAPTVLWQDLEPTEWLTRKWENNAQMLVHSWLVSRELTEAAGPWDAALSLDDDGEYFCRVITHSDGIKFVPASKVFYRTANFTSISNSSNLGKSLDSLFRSIQLQIDYLLSMETNDRTRAACVQYLQKYMYEFYLERPTVVAHMQKLAKQLGGEIGEPVSPRKYRTIHRFFGWRASKRIQSSSRKIKTKLLQSWDHLLFRLEKNRH